MNPLISVVIPTYNYRRYVVEAVESVLAQTYRPLEVIVADDGSTDGTAEELARYGDQIRYTYQPNRGLPAARNLGIRAAAGQHLAFLDSDDLWAPTKIEKQVALIEKSPRVGVVYCDGCHVDLRTGVTQPLSVRPDGRGDLRRRLLHRNCITGSASAVLVRRECFEKAGLFNEDLRSAEDWDMWIRISRHYEFDFVPEPLITLRHHGGNMHKKIALMRRYQLQVIQQAFAEDPVDRCNLFMRQRTRAYISFDSGNEYLDAREYGRAMLFLSQAIAFWPFNYRYYLYLIRAIARKPITAH